MSFYTPEIGIKHYDEIPVLCSQCDARSTWTSLTQTTKETLINASSFHSLTDEMALLKRLEDLITQFPDTRHPLIHSKRRISKRHGIALDDPRINRALDEDPELRDFLVNSGFDIDARLNFVDNRLNNLIEVIGRPDIACRECGAYSYLPENFLMEVGSYLERLPEDGG